MIVVVQTLVFFRESLFGVIQRLIGPYIKSLALSLGKSNNSSDDEISEEQAIADYDEEKGVVFYPPVYAQRYAAVVDCLTDERWRGRLQKIADLGYHDTSFIKYLKDLSGVSTILGVDVDSVPLRCSASILDRDKDIKNCEPVKISLFQGNAADPDYRLIGCDAVVAIEMIEHMLPYDLERLVHTIFGFIKPWVVVLTTPNGDFNVLFKALESNGMRRLDHFFEWSREQFHDWCSNIVTRYPQYMVSCKGIGPGPEGTEHLGCCSQLALFIAKDYHKQLDLNLNSLALVSDPPDSDVGWTNSDGVLDNNEETDKNFDSDSEIMQSSKESFVTFVLTSPSYFSLQSVSYVDKTAQCNRDVETRKNFLMYNDEDFSVRVLKPRRRFDNKIYFIEDVTCRLNCSISQVRRFSKHALELINKEEIDSLAHTTDIVTEIKELTKALNISEEDSNNKTEFIWNNINWGYNAPYWNQYYKIVREIWYPYEEKTQEDRILQIVADELQQVLDRQCDTRHSFNGSIAVSLTHIMNLVAHLTDNVEKIRDLLEWNGYDIVNNEVIYTREIPDESTVSNVEDWDDDDLISDVKATIKAKNDLLNYS